MRLLSHRENGLVNQVNPLGVVHTLTTSNDQNNLQNTHSKIFGRMQNVTTVREVLCEDITISCPYYNLGIDPRSSSLFTRLILTVLCQAY